MSKDQKTRNDPKRLQKARRRRLTERLKTTRERAHSLELELGQFTGDFFRVCIFGSARIQPDDQIFKLTHQMAYLLGLEGIDVLTGGGPGLMLAANQGVGEGRAASGSQSKSFGISIELGGIEPENEHLDIKHHHKKFSSRLDDFMRLSNAVIVTPGGIGTLLELYFSWQLVQVNHIPERPIILLTKNFYAGVIDWMKEVQLKANLVSPSDFNCIHLVDTPEEALQIVKSEHTRFTERLRLLKQLITDNNEEKS